MVFSQLKNAYSVKSLIWTFALIDLKLRYKNSVLGFFWSFLEPLLLLAVLYAVFTYIFPAQIVNYPLYLLLGIIIWSTFTRSTMMGMNSILGRGGLVSTIYFPRITLPISANITSFLMMGFELGVLAIFMIAFQFLPPITILFLPILLLILFLLNLGISFIFSVLYVRYRDIIYIWQVVTTAGFFLTPIIYSLDIFPTEIRRLILINPMAQIIEMSHNAVLYDLLPNPSDFLYTIIVSVAIFLVGLIIFKKREKTIIDDI